MISAVSEINILDEKHRVFGTRMTVRELFANYADNITRTEEGRKFLTFSPDDKIFIGDWQGWTKLERVEMWPEYTGDYYYIESEDERSIVVTAGHKLPVYNPDICKTAYHGSVVYQYNLLRADELTSGFYLKEYGLEEQERITPILFGKCYAEKSRGKYRPPVCHIQTQSGYYMANHFLIADENKVKQEGCR